jgi:hypothetical protein
MRLQSVRGHSGGFCALTLLVVGCAYQGVPGSSAAYQASVAAAPAKASRADLLYVTDADDNDAYMVSLPSGKLVGKLTGFDQPTGDCVDSSGNVFIVDSQNSEIREYKHGAKRAFNVLDDHPYIPIGCSLDPMTGNLAVANCCGHTAMGSVAVYAHARGNPKFYVDSSVEIYWYCSYDSRGDLFVDGIGRNSYQFALLEIPAGRHGFTSISLKPAIEGDVSLPLLWDGDDLAIASPSSGTLEQFQIRGHRGTRIHVTRLDGVSAVYGAFWIARSGKTRTLYAPIVANSIASIGVYHYPSGGKPIADLYAVVSPFAAAVSVRTQ